MRRIARKRLQSARIAIPAFPPPMPMASAIPVPIGTPPGL